MSFETCRGSPQGGLGTSGFLAMWNRTAAVVALILASLVPTTDGIACAAGVSTYTVQDTAGAESLRAGLNCTGGEFLVSWEGNVTLANTLVVYGGTSLTAVGLGESLSLIDGGNKVRLFLVADGTLHLKNLSLERGNATHGGAIYAYGDSAVSLTDCLLQDCRAYNLSGRGGSLIRKIKCTTAKNEVRARGGRVEYWILRWDGGAR